jgi:hypothetical protein
MYFHCYGNKCGTIEKYETIRICHISFSANVSQNMTCVQKWIGKRHEY